MSTFPQSSAPQPAAHPANAQLQALALAHQQGRLDRAQYRARRRNVLEAARQAQGVTLRNALPSVSAARHSPSAVAERARNLRRRAAAIVITVIVVAIILLTFYKCTAEFDRRSARGERGQADRRVIAAMAVAHAARHIGRAQHPVVFGAGVLGEVDVCV